MSAEIDVLIVTGLSGAGRSHAGGVLEDAGYFVVDNLPPKMILPLVDMMMQPGAAVTKLAAVTDIRSRQFFADFNSVLNDLKARGIRVRIIYIEAKSSELVKRYEKVRRPHPLQSSGGGILQAIEQECVILKDLREVADLVIDTTKLSIHDLSRKLLKLLDTDVQREIQIHVQSFGFKHGLPLDAEFVADMRWLPNPFWIDDLRDLNGLSEPVSQYVLNSSGAIAFVDQYVEATTKTFEGFMQENKSHLTVAFGCTGGKHRSVAIAAYYAKQLQKMGYIVTVTNRDIERE
jgi:UPF0042 nucleotide-binding protein